MDIIKKVVDSKPTDAHREGDWHAGHTGVFWVTYISPIEVVCLGLLKLWFFRLHMMDSLYCICSVKPSRKTRPSRLPAEWWKTRVHSNKIKACQAWGAGDRRGGQWAAQPKAACLELRGVIYAWPNKLNKLLKATESKYNLNPETIEKIWWSLNQSFFFCPLSSTSMLQEIM